MRRVEPAQNARTPSGFTKEDGRVSLLPTSSIFRAGRNVLCAISATKLLFFAVAFFGDLLGGFTLSTSAITSIGQSPILGLLRVCSRRWLPNACYFFPASAGGVQVKPWALRFASMKYPTTSPVSLMPDA